MSPVRATLDTCSFPPPRIDADGVPTGVQRLPRGGRGRSAATVLEDLGDLHQVRSISRRPARTGVRAAWPDWVPPEVRQAVGRLGIEQPWRHQVLTAEAARSGHHVVLTTGTASGKSLAFLLPVLADTMAKPAAATSARDGWQELTRPRRPHTALYLAPTKALAHDQLRVCTALGLPNWPIGALDGDTEAPERDWIRDHACYVLSNPDMLHRSVLPHHPRWAGFMQSLRYVVVDEAHHYRGVFGAQVSGVLRRLRRLAAHYGADPVFVLASATSSNAGAAAASLLGVPEATVEVVDRDDAERGVRTLVLWQPDGPPDDDAARLLARLVGAGRQTIAFTTSRRSVEIVAVRAQHELTAAGSTGSVAAYRGGYLAADRRLVEQKLQQRSLQGVAATNALELGVDISGVDAVIVAGFPGTRAAFWQQAGRAGRRAGDALVVFVARQHPLDAYLLDHPEALLAAPVEATVLHPENPYVLGPQLAAAAEELPITEADAAYFGADMAAVLDRLQQQGLLRRRPAGWYWTRPERAVDGIDLRSTGGSSVEIIDTDTGRVLGHLDPAAADATVHPGAVYLHQGDTYISEELDSVEALVRPAAPTYFTQPRVAGGVRILAEHRSEVLGAGRIAFGEVEVTSQVTGFLRRDELTGNVWDETPLDLPERTLRTAGCWWTLDEGLVDDALTLRQLQGGLHGVEHAATNLLPLYAPCDRWDVSGQSAVAHPDTGRLTVFVHDRQPGGSGFAEHGYQVVQAWLTATLERLESCGCGAGCPACVVSPTCGSSETLDKSAAVSLLSHLVGH